MGNIFANVLHAAKSLLRGLRITLRSIFGARLQGHHTPISTSPPSRFQGMLRIKDVIGSPTASQTWMQAVTMADGERDMPYCMDTCPLHQRSGDCIRFIAQRQYLSGLQVLRLNTCYAGTLGRICPAPCEAQCRMGEEGEPIAVRQLERFVADWAMENVPMEQWEPPHIEKHKNAQHYSIAVIGGGPAGMTCAYIMARWGYRVTVFEKRKLLGGYLAVGIPAYRLPKNILDIEHQSVMRYGIEVRLDCEIGKDITFDEIHSGYDAVMLASGSSVPLNLGIPGDALEGVIVGESFLERVNLGEKGEIEKDIVVIGFAFTAIACARTALRLGADNVYLLCNRRYDDVLKRYPEIAEAKAEGCKVMEMVIPSRIIGKGGKVKGVELLRLEVGDVGTMPNGLKPVEGSAFILPADTVLTALSRIPDSGFLPENMGFEFNDIRAVVVDGNSATGVEGVFAAGESVTGPRPAVSAMSGALLASEKMAQFLQARTPKMGGD